MNTLPLVVLITPGFNLVSSTKYGYTTPSNNIRTNLGGAKALPDSQWAYKLASEFSSVGCEGTVAGAEQIHQLTRGVSMELSVSVHDFKSFVSEFDKHFSEIF